MTLCIYLHHADVVHEVFAVVVQQEGVQPDRGGLVGAAGVSRYASTAAFASLPLTLGTILLFHIRYFRLYIS